MNDNATIPRTALMNALHKARIEYVRVAKANGQDPGPPDECWAEFEALADYIGVGVGDSMPPRGGPPGGWPVLLGRQAAMSPRSQGHRGTG